MTESHTPLFSIVIANYNYGRFLEDAIKSVLTQSCQDFELIICDAASTDNSVEIIKKYADRIAWWCSEPDGGQSAAFNKGFSHATGRFLTWLNADDILFSDALSSVSTEIVRHPRCEWFTGSSAYVDSSLKLTRFFCAHRFSALRARYGMLMVGGPSSFFTHRLFNAAGGVDERLHFLMDIDLWYKFFLVCGARYVRTRKPIFAYRIHSMSKMSGADVENNEANQRHRQLAADELRLLEQRHGLNHTGMRKLFTCLTFSPIDRIYSLWNERRMKGLFLRHA